MNYKTQWVNNLIKWYAEHGRDLPWRSQRDPYAIWLSEVLLQQTRVEQGTPYFLRFLARFPRVQDLALADIQEVLSLWQGLGYYRRAHHLHQAAKRIVKEGGIFPQTPSQWQKLPGVGSYTAAAIASIAFDYPEPVVDGNVIRVLSRAFGATEPFDTASGRRWVYQTALELMDPKQAGDYNQAIMDMGATLCTPKKPSCSACFWQKNCYAFQNQKVDALPWRSKKTSILAQTIDYLVLLYGDEVLLFKRPDTGVWAGLYEFWVQPWSGAWDSAAWDRLYGKDWPAKGLEFRNFVLKHALSHRSLTLNLNCIRLHRKLHHNDGVWVTFTELDRYPLPQPLLQFLKQTDFNHGRTQQSHAYRQSRQRP
ncbi:MAG: A/G-specific adenine glycosylase [Bacteroidia bacterium]